MSSPSLFSDEVYRDSFSSDSSSSNKSPFVLNDSAPFDPKIDEKERHESLMMREKRKKRGKMDCK